MVGQERTVVPLLAEQVFGLETIAASLTFIVAFGLGTRFGAARSRHGLVNPTLLAAVSDIANPSRRASAIGAYRFWRDTGFALGAIAAGLLADAFGRRTAIGAIATLTALSGMVVAVRMYETHPAQRRMR
jgi:MFS family permease